VLLSAIVAEDGDAHVPVVINLNVAIDANSNVTVLGEARPTLTNVVDAEYRLPVNALYDGANSKGLLEMWEPADAPGEIKVKFAETDSSAVPGGSNLSVGGGVWKETIRKLGRGLHKVLVNPLDCSAAVPFNDTKYAGVVEYTKQRDFGRLALGAFAHFFFGHVDATAAITNDATFVANMLSITPAAAVDESVSARYDAWTKKSQVETGNFATWTSATTPAGSASDANLAQRLTQAIYSKGANADGTVLTVSSVNSSTPTGSLAHIVKQVIGQDAKRTMLVDGSERTRNVHQLVRFYPDDVIYVNITLKTPSITVGTNTPSRNGQQGVTQSGLADSYATEQNYTIKITLGAADNTL
jgi:hypothetical protein